MFLAAGKRRARLSKPSCAAWVPKPPSSQADAAFGPDRGETLGKMCDTYPAKLVNDKYLTPDAAGFLCIDRSKFSAAA